MRFFVQCLLSILLSQMCVGDFGSVVDLKVELYQDENAGLELLKLNVSWCPPKGIKMPSSYSVVVTGVPENMMDCPEGSMFYTSKDNKELSVLLPQTSDIIDMSEMHISPGCSYEIEVRANPRLRASIKPPKIIYKVPDCISNKCKCISKSTLPVPKVNIIEKGTILYVEWNAVNDSNIHFYSISVGHPILTSRNGQPVYNTTKIGEVRAPTTTFQLNQVIESGFKIGVSAVDFRGCIGNEGIFIVGVPVGKNSSTIIWLLLIGAIAICSTIALLLLIKTREKQKLSSITRIHSISKSTWAEALLNKQNILYVRYDPQADCSSDTDNLEFSYKNLTLINELGSGQFGKVYLGRLDDKTLVAVKTSQSFDEVESKKQFMEEIDIMRQAGNHPNLIKLIGYCSQPEKPVCIILEYMEGGDLLAYLHSRRKLKRNRVNGQSTSGRSGPSISETLYTTLSYTSEDSQENQSYNSLKAQKYSNILEEPENFEDFEDGSIGRKQFLQFSMDIASGMRHLESKGITHRDLASRNILIASNLTLKISDFGLSREGIYVIKTKGSKARHLPIRWMSPEAIRDRAFSTKSDVWAFAIVLWEIGTLGSFPYPSIRDDSLLKSIVKEGARLEKPDTISTDIYRLMEQCWETEPENRPSFQQIFYDLRSIGAPISLTTAENPCYALPLETLHH